MKSKSLSRFRILKERVLFNRSFHGLGTWLKVGQLGAILIKSLVAIIALWCVWSTVCEPFIVNSSGLYPFNAIIEPIIEFAQDTLDIPIILK